MSYLDKSEIINIDEIINPKYKFRAHKKMLNGIYEYESLKEHTKLSNKYFIKLYDVKSLGEIFKRFEDMYLKHVSKEGIDIFRKLLINVVNFHDIGKINPNFQRNKMDNKLFEEDKFSTLKSKHSIISAVIYIDYFFREIKSLDKTSEKILKQFLYLNAYVIAKHHGDLDSFEKFINGFGVIDGAEGQAQKVIITLNDAYKDVVKEFSTSEGKGRKAANNVKKSLDKLSKEEGVYLYAYERLLFSILLACDFYSTSEFMSGVAIDNFGELSNISEFYDVYKNTGIYKRIRRYEENNYGRRTDFKEEKNINVLRTEMFLDAEKTLEKNKNGEIFYLEAPTGGGKSNISINLSFKFMEYDNNFNKIYYVYPFNTLVEQNEKNLNSIFGENQEVLSKIAVINSITPIKLDVKDDNRKSENENKEEYMLTDEEEYKKYAKALLNRQFLNYPMILITHVGIFNTMFDTDKNSIFSFHQLTNSVIVLDEIQSYRLTIWTEIISFLKAYSKLLNIKVIIMSATLPNLDILTEIKGQSINLIENRDKYFTNPLFKNRVEIDYELIDKDIEGLFNHVLEKSKLKKKILIEFIKKKTAYEFYNKLKEYELDCQVALLTGDDNAIDRANILNNIKSEKTMKEGIILVATQVIEAGVDIDMDIGYKDISRLDGDEQFMGRINRSCLRDGIVYFFNVDEAEGIYKGDIRANKENSLVNEGIKDILLSKDFKKYYENILISLKEHYNHSLKDSLNIERFFKEDVGGLNFINVAKRMKLIEDNMLSMSVYLARKIEIENKNISDGENAKNTEVLDGKDIWNQYIELLRDNKIKYAEKEVKLSQVRSKMNYFIYQIQKNNDLLYNDIIGELYYIEDGEEYFKDGKVDKEKLVTGIGDFI